MASTDNTAKLVPGVTSVVKLTEGPVQEMVGTGLPCAVQLNVAWRDWFTVRSTGGLRMKGWAGRRGGGEKVADSEWEIHRVCLGQRRVGIKILSFTTIAGSHSQKITTSVVLLAMSTTFSAVHV